MCSRCVLRHCVGTRTHSSMALQYCDVQITSFCENADNTATKAPASYAHVGVRDIVCCLASALASPRLSVERGVWSRIQQSWSECWSMYLPFPACVRACVGPSLLLLLLLLSHAKFWNPQWHWLHLDAYHGASRFLIMQSCVSVLMFVRVGVG